MRRLAILVGSAQDELRRRPRLWIAPGLAVALAIAGSFRLTFDNRPETWIESSSVRDRGGEARGFYLLVRENVDVGADSFVTEDRELSRLLAALPGVAGVESVSRVLGEAGKPSLRELGDGARFLDGYLLFEDRRTAILRVWLAEGSNVSEIRDRIRAIPLAADLRVLGPSAFAARIDDVARREGARALPIAVVAAFAVQVLAFRSLRLAVAATLSSLLRVLVCVGIFGWAGVSFNFLTVNVPILAFVISVALEVHPLREWTRLWRRAESGRALSLRAVAAKTFPGCFLSALTTAVGFGSLALAEFGAVREFGLLTGVAITVVFACGVMTFPVLVRMADRSRPAAPPSRVFRRLALASTRHPLLVTSTSLVVIAVSAVAVARLEVNHDSLGFFSRDDEFRLECERARGTIGGLAPLELLVSLPRSGSTPEALRLLATFTRELESGCGARAVSILDPIKLGASLLAGGAAGSFRLPASDLSLGAAHQLATRLPDVRSRFTTGDETTFRVFLSVDVFSSEDLAHVLSRVAAATSPFPGVQARPTGIVYELMDMQAAILHEQLTSLGIVAVCVASLVGVYFASAAYGLLALLVNLAPVLVVGAIVVLMEVPLDLTTAMVAGVALGISVDDTIHLLWEYRRNARAPRDRTRRVLARVGPPIVVTTLIVVAGFLALGAARFPPISRLGWLVGGCLALSLPFQLLALPSLLELWNRGARPRMAAPESPVRVWRSVPFCGVLAAILVSCESPERIPPVDRSAPSPESSEPLQLLDQYDRRWSADEVLSGPTVLILTSRETAEEGTEWDNQVIRRRRPSIPVHRVLDLHPLPTLVASFVKARIRENTRPPGTPVLLDWSGEVARRFSVAGQRAAVLVLDEGGEVVFRAEGGPNPETTNGFAAAVKDLSRRSSGAP